MATAEITYVFSNGTSADAGQVDQNFADLVAFLNTEVLQIDGSVAMVGALTLPGAPTNVNHAVTKAYSDDGPPALQLATVAPADEASAVVGVSQGWGAPSDVITITNPSRSVALLMQLTGYADIEAGTSATAQCWISYSLDGGSTFSTGQVAVASVNATNPERAVLATHKAAVGTPTGNIVVKAILLQTGGSAGDVHFLSGYLSCLMIPA